LQVAQALIRSPRDGALRGLFHMAGGGDANWADLAKATFLAAEAFGRRPVAVRAIASAQYPTPAPRPANSRLDCSKLARTYAVALPDWRPSLDLCVARALNGDAKG
jgi:dTDP-4-dehydrorhamnose reductase